MTRRLFAGYLDQAARPEHQLLQSENPATDLTSDLPHAEGYNVLREILLVADHNAYHIGEFALLRQVMGTWPKDRST